MQSKSTLKKVGFDFTHSALTPQSISTHYCSSIFYEHSLQIHQPHHLQSRSPTISSAKSDAPFNQNRSLALGSTLSRPTTSDEYQNRHAIVPRTSFPPVRSLNQMYMRTLREDLMSVRQRVREAEQSFHMRSFPYRTQSEESESLYKQTMEHYDDIDSARH